MRIPSTQHHGDDDYSRDDDDDDGGHRVWRSTSVIAQRDDGRTPFEDKVVCEGDCTQRTWHTTEPHTETAIILDRVRRRIETPPRVNVHTQQLCTVVPGICANLRRGTTREDGAVSMAFVFATMRGLFYRPRAAYLL